MYKFEGYGNEVLFIGLTNNLNKSLNYLNLPSELKDNFDEKKY